MSSRNAHLGIVVGVDDSPAAKVAVDWAARDAELTKCLADARARGFAELNHVVEHAAAPRLGAMAERTRAPTA